MGKQGANPNDVFKAAEEQYKQAESEKEAIVKEYEDICAQIDRATDRIKDKATNFGKAEAVLALENLEDDRKSVYRTMRLAMAKLLDAREIMIKARGELALSELPAIVESKNKTAIEIVKLLLDLAKAVNVYDQFDKKQNELTKLTELAELNNTGSASFSLHINEIKKFIFYSADYLDTQNQLLNKYAPGPDFKIVKEQICETKNLTRPA